MRGCRLKRRKTWDSWTGVLRTDGSFSDSRKEYSKRRPSVEEPIVTGSTYRLFFLEFSDLICNGSIRQTPRVAGQQGLGT